jgi:hypothetical protein
MLLELTRMLLESALRIKPCVVNLLVRHHDVMEAGAPVRHQAWRQCCLPMLRAV